MLVWVGHCAAKCRGAGAPLRVLTSTCLESAEVPNVLVSRMRKRKSLSASSAGSPLKVSVPWSVTTVSHVGASKRPRLFRCCTSTFAMTRSGLAGNRPGQGDGVVVGHLAPQVHGRIGQRRRLHEDADRHRRAEAVLVGEGQRHVDSEGRLRRRREPAGILFTSEGGEYPAAVARPQVGQVVATVAKLEATGRIVAGLLMSPNLGPTDKNLSPLIKAVYEAQSAASRDTTRS